MKKFWLHITSFALVALFLIGCENPVKEVDPNFVYIDKIGSFQHIDFESDRLAYPVVHISHDKKSLRFFPQRPECLTLYVFSSCILTDSMYIIPNIGTIITLLNSSRLDIRIITAM